MALLAMASPQAPILAQAFPEGTLEVSLKEHGGRLYVPVMAPDGQTYERWAVEAIETLPAGSRLHGQRHQEAPFRGRELYRDQTMLMRLTLPTGDASASIKQNKRLVRRR